MDWASYAAVGGVEGRPASRGVEGEGCLLMRKMFVLVAVVAVVAAAVAALGTGKALAYGHADHPVAQLTLSANCDNPSFPLCAPPPDGVGLGGIWAWIEVDQGGTGDMTGAECGHTVHGGGPGSAGAGPLGPSDITWETVSAADIPSGFFQLGTDPNDQYYIVNELGPFAFPVTTGHYSVRLAPGVQIQATVAP
jgi:hypothetical protein